MGAQSPSRGVGGIVGRDRELRVLRQQLDRVRSGGSPAVAVVGEAGIGKTYLLQDLGRRAEVADCVVAAGRGSELESEVPFGLVAAALDESVAALDRAALMRLGNERLAELTVVFPSLEGMAGHLTRPLEVERYRCHYAVHALLTTLTREHPVVLVLDDLHWADPASVELVSHLLRRRVKGVFLVLAYRPQAPVLLVRTALRAMREQHLKLLELGPLSRDEAAEILGTALSGSVDVLYEQSGGNPFYLEQLARVRRTREELLSPAEGRQALTDAGAPEAVRAAIEQDLATLSPLARLLAQSAAVAGDPFDITLATRVADMDEQSASAALDELVPTGLVQPTDVAGRLQFRHPITRRAVYDAAGHGWRLLAHRRAARVLAEHSAPLGVQAQHVVRSAAAVGNEDAIALLIDASSAAAPRAPVAAAQWLEGAVRLLPPDAPPERRVGLLVPLSDAFATVGRWQDARSALVEALDQVRADDLPTLARLTAMLARIEHQLGNGEDSHRLLKRVLEECEPGTREAAELTLELARSHSLLGAWQRAAEVAAVASDLCRSVGDQELTIGAAVSRVFFESYGLGTAPRDTGEDLLAVIEMSRQDAAARIDAVQDAEMTPALLEALVYLIYTEVTHEVWGDAERHAQRGARICRATGQGARFLDFQQLLVPVWLLQGRLAAARQVADVVREASHIIENDHALILYEAHRCWVASLQGQTSVALAAGGNAVTAAKRTPHAQFAWLAHLVYGEALVDAGRQAEGRAGILMAGGPDLTHVAPTVRPRWHMVLAEAELAAGRIDEAEKMAARARAVADKVDLPRRAKAHASYAEAAVLLAREQAESAVECAGESCATYEAAGVHLEAARAKMLVGLAHAGAGRPDTAVEALESAHRTFESCGAARLADRAARELRRLGRKVARRSTTDQRERRRGPEALSPREREVAALVAEGHTNRQIADKLYLSAKTVDTHIAHIYAKIGVSSRAAMASALADTI